MSFDANGSKEHPLEMKDIEPELTSLLSKESVDVKKKGKSPKVKDSGEGQTQKPDDSGLADIGPPPSFGKLLRLSRQEWPSLFVAFVLMVAGEGLTLAPPLVLATAYNVVVDPTKTNEEMVETVRNGMMLVLVLHFGGVILGFIRASILGVAGVCYCCCCY